jgi:polyhydroxyalkanoate synthase
VDSATWLAQSARAEGSWWQLWSSWLAERSDPQWVDPPAIGSPAHDLHALYPAPGTYVHQH